MNNGCPSIMTKEAIIKSFDNKLPPLLLKLYPNVAKVGRLQSQEEPLSKIKLEASSRNAGASEGEVVVLYFKPSATQNLKSSGSCKIQIFTSYVRLRGRLYFVGNFKCFAADNVVRTL